MIKTTTSNSKNHMEERNPTQKRQKAAPLPDEDVSHKRKGMRSSLGQEVALQASKRTHVQFPVEKL